MRLTDLPPAHAKRWGPRRKALVVAAIRGGLLSLDEAATRYDLSLEEYLTWNATFDRIVSCRRTLPTAGRIEHGRAQTRARQLHQPEQPAL